MSKAWVTPLPTEALAVCCINSSDGERAHEVILTDALGLQDTMDYLGTLIQQEREAYSISMDFFLNSEGKENTETSPCAPWRRKLSEWCYQVVDHFGYDREVAAICLNYLDRAVAVKSSDGEQVSKRDYQLYAVTCLYMAVKIHGECETPAGVRTRMQISHFVDLSRKVFSVKVIEQAEQEILTLLDWRVNPPTSMKFVLHFLRMCPRWTTTNNLSAQTKLLAGIHDISRYLAELAVCSIELCGSYNTSQIAYACILIALEVVQETILSLPYDVRAALQNNVAKVSGLAPNSADTVRVKELVRDLCPESFSDEEGGLAKVVADRFISMCHSPMGQCNSGEKSSPTSVAESIVESRKRFRSNPHDGYSIDCQ